MDSNANFYRDLRAVDKFENILIPTNFQSLPESWLVAVTDIVNSTAAIARAQYKQVNILGASPIMGILNYTDRESIPYVFGGDGAVICVPPGLDRPMRNVLLRCRQIGKEEYGLILRAALIPVGYIIEQGFEIQVARYKASAHYSQAIFTGGGIRYAEELIKSEAGSPFGITYSGDVMPVDFSGLECRWKEVGTGLKEVITLMVRTHSARHDQIRIYGEVVEKLREQVGFEMNANPIVPASLDMNFSISELMAETRFRTFGMNAIQRLKYLLKVEMEVLLGKVFMRLGYRSSKTDWGRYKPDLALNSDFRKFDDMLRAVVCGTPEQRNKLEAFLHEKFENAELAYGMHIAEAAMVTCMVFSYQGEHVHFVDGCNGGYVEAAKDLKRRMDRLES